MSSTDLDNTVKALSPQYGEDLTGSPKTSKCFQYFERGAAGLRATHGSNVWLGLDRGHRVRCCWSKAFRHLISTIPRCVQVLSHEQAS